MQFVRPTPFREAVLKLGDRTPIGSLLTSSEWADVPVALRERAFFSSTVESIRFLDRAQGALGDFLAANRDESGALSVGSRADFLKQLQDFAISEGLGPLDPADAGSLQDITSERRLGLIFDIQNQAANDYGYWKQGQDPDVLDEFPAQRFIRVLDVKEPRAWHEQFDGQVYLKSDPVWVTINEDFGVPWGPWGWGCGHDVEDVDRAEAESLGLLQPGQAVEPSDLGFNDRLQASAGDLPEDLLTKLQEEFGDKILVANGSIQWKGSSDDQSERVSHGPSRWLDDQAHPDARRIGRAGQEVFGGIRSRDTGEPLPAKVAFSGGAEIAAVASGRKPLYHEQWGQDVGSDLASRLQALALPGVTVSLQEGHLFAYRPEIIQQIIDADPAAYPGASLADKIYRASVAGKNGKLLGYGAASMLEPGLV